MLLVLFLGVSFGILEEMISGALRMDVKPEYWMPVEEQAEAGHSLGFQCTLEA